MINNKITFPVPAINSPDPELALLVKSSVQLPVPATLIGRVGGIIVVRQPENAGVPKQISLLTQKLMDTAFKFFKIFPNPVSSGASLHLEWKQTEEGYFTFELLDVSGKRVYAKEIWIDQEARLLNIEVPSVGPGSYLLRATNKESGKGFTEKIAIQ